MKTQMIKRRVVEDLVERRNRALENYELAHETLVEASEYLDAARFLAYNDHISRYNSHLDVEKMRFYSKIKVPAHDEYMKTARRLVDTDSWEQLVHLTDISRLLDKTGKDELYQSLLQEAPEVTIENIYATLEQLALNADLYFKRGVATCFSSLDRRFRSHDGWKIGSRVVLTRAFDEHGFWNYHQDAQSTIIDVERALFILDDKIYPGESPALVAIQEAREDKHYYAHAAETETEYFKIRTFKNGNAHLWFKRKDLLEKVNKLLAEYYGWVIPEGETFNDDGPDLSPKTSLAKNYGYYPTPESVVHRMHNNVHLEYLMREGAYILEPSAGDGNLVKDIKGCHIHCYEVHPGRAESLRAQRKYEKVVCGDFLSFTPDMLYDAVLMNPPFDRDRDVDHVFHALKWLKPKGLLISVMGAGVEFRTTNKAKALRAYVEGREGRFFDLPMGSFRSVGTNINTVLLEVNKEG